MTSYDFDLAVIGSGPAGQRAAIQAAKIGRRVAVIEQMPALGGVCILTGTVPSKTLREAVISMTSIADIDQFRPGGKLYQDRPPMARVLGRVQDVMMTEATVVKNQLTRNGVEIIQGTGRFTGPHEVTATGLRGIKTITAENVMISVGTRPAMPDNVPVDGAVVMTSDEILAMGKLPRTMMIVGGGVIGMEYASMFANLGVKVRVIDRHNRALDFVDPELVAELVKQLEAHNCSFFFDDSVSKIVVHDGSPPHAAITLESGTTFDSDVVLYSIGRIAATDQIGLDRIGLKAGRRGVLEVDADYRTAVPHVYAAGDVIGFPALAATSSEQGRIAACRMFGIDAPSIGQTYPYGIYTIPEISMVGQTEEQLQKENVPFEVGIARYSEIARGQILGDDSGLFKMFFHRDTAELLGVHCIGTGATELVHVGQAVLKLRGGLDYFLTTVFNYPTLAECYKVAAYDAANRMDYRHVSLETPGSLRVDADHPFS